MCSLTGIEERCFEVILGFCVFEESRSFRTKRVMKIFVRLKINIKYRKYQFSNGGPRREPHKSTKERNNGGQHLDHFSLDHRPLDIVKRWLTNEEEIFHPSNRSTSVGPRRVSRINYQRPSIRFRPRRIHLFETR